VQNINRVVITGNLTRDPEIRDAQSGTKVCTLRVACNGRVKRGEQWEDKPNYFDVVVFGRSAENCAKYLSKGRGVAVSGRLDWSEWQDKEGNKRQSVQVIADDLQFLGDGSGSGSSSESTPPPVTAAAPSTASDDFGADDDIPF
jgi:single-strand DNA-binding protein